MEVSKMDWKKVMAAIMILAAFGLGVFSGFLADSPNVIVEEKLVEVPIEKIVTEYVDVLVDVEKIVEVEKLVDNGNLGKVVEFAQDNIDEDITVEYVLFQYGAKPLAKNWIEENFIGLLKSEDYFDNGELLENYRSSEVSIKKIGDATILDRDFEDLNLELEYKVKIKAEDGEDKEYFEFNVTIPFEDGELVEDDVDFDVA